MSRFAVSPDAACAQVADGAVLLHLGSKRYYSLNETGALVWQSLEDGRSITDIVARLQENYDVDQGEAEQSVGRLLRELDDAALIVSASE